MDETWLAGDRSAQTSRVDTAFKGLGRLDGIQEREMIEAALAQSEGRISDSSGAAAKLRIPRQTLESRIACLGIDKYRFKSK